MKFTETYSYDAPLAKVWEMLSDPAFVAARDDALQIPNPKVETQANANQIVSVTSGAVPPEMIPAAAQRFLKGATSFVIREEWRRGAAGAASGKMTVEGKGVPASLKANIVLKEAGDQTQVTMEGELKVGIPFLGPKLEKQAIGFAPQLVAGDQKAAQDWLANH